MTNQTTEERMAWIRADHQRRQAEYAARRDQVIGEAKAQGEQTARALLAGLELATISTNQKLIAVGETIRNLRNAAAAARRSIGRTNDRQRRLFFLAELTRLEAEIAVYFNVTSAW